MPSLGHQALDTKLRILSAGIVGLSGAMLHQRQSHRVSSPLMNVRVRPYLALLASALLASSLTGCSSINEKLTNSVGDYIPQWAGGLPADAPPRPGTPQYDAYMKERERLRMMPAAERPQQPQA